jgi:uncharacterized protein (TIGR02271 family)
MTVVRTAPMRQRRRARIGDERSRAKEKAMERTVVAVFDSRQKAQAAWQDVVACGVDQGKVHLREGSLDDVPGAQVAEQAIRRAGWGDVLGEEHEGEYREALRRGSCLVAVDPIPEDKAIDVAAALSRHDPIDLDDRAAGWRERGWKGHDASSPQLSDEELRKEREWNAQRLATARSGAAQASNATGTQRTAEMQGAAAGERTTLPVVEEELAVGKRVVQRGGVRIYTRVIERPVEEDVTLREEHARVDRHAVNRPASEAELGNAFKEGSVELRETAEEAVVSKQARVVEEVDVGKEVTERTQKVSDTVRRSEVEVEDLPGSRTGATDEGVRTPRRR